MRTSAVIQARLLPRGPGPAIWPLRVQGNRRTLHSPWVVREIKTRPAARRFRVLRAQGRWWATASTKRGITCSSQ
jgi:hypothetical protein